MRTRTLGKLLGSLIADGPRAMLVTITAKRRGAKQKIREFSRLCRLVRSRTPSVVVEIGTMHGGTLWAWCRLAARDALVVSIDLPGGPFGGGHDPSQADVIRSYARPEQCVELISGDSHDPATLRELRRTLNGRSVDFLFIDGDHTYEGVRRDFQMYGPLVREGLIAFHDVLPCRPENGNVSRLWEEVRATHKSLEFLDESDVSWRGAWGGIGVLVISPSGRYGLALP